MTVILAGYKQDIEEKVLATNDGFRSRFTHHMLFEDYTEEELRNIFVKMCDDSRWQVDAEAQRLAGRRLSRGRGRKGFGNARDARTLVQTAYNRAIDRGERNYTLTTVDVIGDRPTRENTPDLHAALCELEGMVGLDSVKRAIDNLVTLAEKYMVVGC